MATREMSAEEHAQTARDFLVASDREFATGDHLQGSEKLYGAATQAIIALCQERGWRYKSHRAMQQAVTALSREYDDPDLSTALPVPSGFTRISFMITWRIMRLSQIVQEYTTSSTGCWRYWTTNRADDCPCAAVWMYRWKVR